MENRILDHYLDEFQTGCDLDPAEAESLFDALITSEDAELVARVLSAWNEKGSTEDELFSMAQIIRTRMKRIASRYETFVDAVGTGGSPAKTFNVSTASSFVIAGAGLPVAKHGNRAATSNSGSSDALSELGIDVDVEPRISERNLNVHGLCFMFAPRFHSFSPTLAAARRSVGRPTIFNNLGPLCNPASAPHHVIGVWNAEMLDSTARVLALLGAERSWVVHAENGLDEISITGQTHVAEVGGDSIKRFVIAGPDFGVYSLGKGLPSKCTAKESARLIGDILDNKMKDTDPECLVLVNAAAAIFVAGMVPDLTEAYDRARVSVRSGSAAAKLEALRETT
ncbi:anthranilate phosphoribosyltransferase [soil metagenome]